MAPFTAQASGVRLACQRARRYRLTEGALRAAGSLMSGVFSRAPQQAGGEPAEKSTRIVAQEKAVCSGPAGNEERSEDRGERREADRADGEGGSEAQSGRGKRDGRLRQQRAPERRWIELQRARDEPQLEGEHRRRGQRNAEHERHRAQRLDERK